jgi:hypothetical protein
MHQYRLTYGKQTFIVAVSRGFAPADLLGFSGESAHAPPMTSSRVRVFSLALLWSLPAAVQAQPAPDSLQVPVGVFRVLGVPVDTNRPVAMLRAIRVLHSAPRRDPLPQPIAMFDRLLEALDRLDRALARTGTRDVTLAMAAQNEDALRDTLEALGLRLRERRGGYTVEPRTGDSDVALRALLLKADVDVSIIEKRLNSGETVQIAPTAIDVPLPVPLEKWSSDVFGTSVTAHRLFASILRSRDASLLYYGAQAMTAETRAYLVKTPEIVDRLHGHAPVVAAFGGAFRVGANGTTIMPGGDAAADLWEQLVDEKLAQPDRFGRELFGRDGGRLAYFVDTLWAFDEARARFVLGLWIADRRLRHERFEALYQAFAQVEPSWSVADAPFMRPSYDAALLLSNLHLSSAGALAGPVFRRLWERGVDGIELPGPDDRQMREAAEDGIADAAFLASLLSGRFLRERRVIIERIAFGQRNFGEANDAEMQDVLVALRAYGRYPAAMLALERIGVRKPALFALAARRVAVLEAIDAEKAVPLLAQFQGSLALLERLARTAAIPSSGLEQSVTSLLAVTLDDERYRGGIAEWLRTQLIPALPAEARTTELEERLLDAFVDRVDAAGRPFTWEGEDFVLDVQRPRRELRAVRERQKGNSLDSLLAVYAHVTSLSTTSLTLEAVKAGAAAVRADGAKLAAARPWPDAPNATPAVARVVERVVKDLNGIRKPGDVAKTPRMVRPLLDVLDYLLGETLVALAYAGSQGDAGRAAAAAIDLSHRHVFGFSTTVGDARQLVPWRRPTSGTTVNGDAVTGSVMGVDLALSKTRLKRLIAQALAETPRLNLNDRETMTDTVAMLNPRDVDDAAGVQLAAAVRRGEARVEQSEKEPARLDALAVEARIDPLRRGLLDWTARYAAADVRGMFSLAELFRLGGGSPSTVNGWGTSHEPVTGCLCVRFPDDTAWPLAMGRLDTGQTTARLADLNLRVAMWLADLGVPAGLFPSVMAFATQDYIDSVPLVHADDWIALAERGAALSRERVEDYISAVLASGPVRAVEGVGAR